ncbi:MAG: haloacid dehalogenase type II [Hyphomicrobiaceae bacterium]
MNNLEQVRALLFDVFGTVVDWRSSIVRELEMFGQEHGIERDWTAFGDAWRGLYQPSMEAVRSGTRPWTILDTLHRESLDTLLAEHGITGLTEARTDHLNRAWHRLTPWPDSVLGLTRLKTRYTLATLSNGNIALLVNMAKNAGLPWDAILGAEPAQAYKPLPEAYLRTAGFLGLEPHQCLMVAAHNNDLEHASALGLRTAFVCRPTEYGPEQSADLTATGNWDIVTESMTGVADALGI